MRAFVCIFVVSVSMCLTVSANEVMKLLNNEVWLSLSLSHDLSTQAMCAEQKGGGREAGRQGGRGSFLDCRPTRERAGSNEST